MAHRNKPVVLTSDFGPRTSDFFPDTCFSSPFVFMNISGCTFIFVGQETEDSGDRTVVAKMFRRFGLWRRTSDFGLRTLSLTPGT